MIVPLDATIQPPAGRTHGRLVSRTVRAWSVALALLTCGVSARAHAQSGASAAVLLHRQGDDLVLEIGPIDVPRADGQGSIAPPSVKVVLPVNGWLNGFRLEVVDEQGAPLPTDLVTINVLSLRERELFAPVALRLAAVAPGSPAVELPRLIGYRATAGDTLLVSSRFHPQSSRGYAGVRARLRFPYVSAAAFIGAIRIQPFEFEVMSPGGAHEYDLPVGFSEHSWEGPPAFDGRILGLGGYVKRWATRLRFEDRTTGKILWECALEPAADGAVPSIPIARFLATLGLRVHRDHRYRLTVQYDNRAGAVLRGGGVGMIAGVFLPGGGPWPSADRNDPVYLADLLGFLK
ncbi:MAG: hypothetical protein HY084_12760 [Gemmatimonadetes bacterium]|nr:hypothetical protein [Gemmatimonadota bacterium]